MSHGHCSRSVRASWWKRTYSAPTGAARSGIHSDVRWSASTVRSSSAQVVCTIRSSGVPSAWSIVTGSSPVAPSTASLMSREHPVGVGVGDEQRAAFARLRRWRTRGRRRAGRRPRPGRCRAGRRRRRGTTCAGRISSSTSGRRRRRSVPQVRTVRSSTSGEPGRRRGSRRARGGGHASASAISA